LVDGVLYIYVQEPPGVIPALHLIEYFHASDYKIDNIIMSRLSERCDFKNGKCENHNNIKDISEWKQPNKKSIMIIQKRKNTYIGDMLNSYNNLLNYGRERIKIEYPRDVIIKGASTTGIEELLNELESNSIPYIGDQPGFDISLLEEDITQDIVNKIGKFPMYYITQKVRMTKSK